jgi:predicted acyltransferase
MKSAQLTTSGFRCTSLDVFRGLTIALMIMVNSPGNLTPYAWLEHSVWNGCTFADIVFPFFVVIVGISSVLALSNLLDKGVPFSQLFEKVCRRSLYIFFMGLLLNAFPHHFDWSSLRVMGVLQRIAICYFVSALLYLTTRIRTQILITIGLLIGYAYLMTSGVGVFEGQSSLSLDGNLVGYLDRWLLTPSHMYTPTFDPEGLLSTIPAISSVLLGNIIGYCLTTFRSKSQLAWGMLIGGVLLAVIGWVWNFSFPLNKALWSSSYVVWTGGLALIIFSMLYTCIEIFQYKRWSKPFDIFGRHAMLVYMLHVLFLKIQAMIHIQHSNGTVTNLRLTITDILFAHFSAPIASLLYSISYTLLWLFVLTMVQHIKIKSMWLRTAKSFKHESLL